MKRYMRGLVTLIVILGFSGGSASALEGPCDGNEITISNTGPGSTNTVVCVTNTKLNVVCSNNVYILDSNSQAAVSGAATQQGNSGGGSAVSGNATNSNGDNVQIGASCGVPAATTPVTPTTPTPVAPPTPPTGMGAAVPTKATVLPNTAGTSTTEVAIAGVIALVSVLALSQFALRLYRRSALK